MMTVVDIFLAVLFHDPGTIRGQFPQQFLVVAIGVGVLIGIFDEGSHTLTNYQRPRGNQLAELDGLLLIVLGHRLRCNAPGLPIDVVGHRHRADGQECRRLARRYGWPCWVWPAPHTPRRSVSEAARPPDADTGKLHSLPASRGYSRRRSVVIRCGSRPPTPWPAGVRLLPRRPSAELPPGPAASPRQ